MNIFFKDVIPFLSLVNDDEKSNIRVTTNQPINQYKCCLF